MILSNIRCQVSALMNLKFHKRNSLCCPVVKRYLTSNVEQNLQRKRQFTFKDLQATLYITVVSKDLSQTEQFLEILDLLDV